MSTIKTFGPVDERSLKQLERCMEAGDAAFGVLCADHHPGYSQPIGGGIAYEGYVSPSGVGYDIGCIAEGARVTTADGYSLPIERVSAKTPVSCLDVGHLRRVTPHFGAAERGLKQVCELVLANGRSLRLTLDHRILTPRGWVEAASLRHGLCLRGRTPKRRWKERFRVYDRRGGRRCVGVGFHNARVYRPDVPARTWSDEATRALRSCRLGAATCAAS